LGCHVSTAVPYAQSAGNNLVHKADQIINSHVEEFICSRSASKRGGGWGRQKTGYRWIEVVVAQGHSARTLPILKRVAHFLAFPFTIERGPTGSHAKRNALPCSLTRVRPRDDAGRASNGRVQSLFAP